MEPIVELVVSENIMEKLFLWSLRRKFTDETKIEQLKMNNHFNSRKRVGCPLNKLCSIIAKDPSILELFSTLEKGEEWHCLMKDDWHLSPALVQFINSLEFCNAVIQVAHPLICKQLVNYIYNRFLLPVMAPALHK
ncbi:hypothetical protein Nmel_006957, partial [Mimus melanotis]